LFPTSAFFLPVQATQQEFIKILKQEKFSHLSTSIKSDKGDFKTFIGALSACFHVEIINNDEKTASLYGKSIQDHKLCFYAKNVGNSYSVDLKCTDPVISESILSELNDFWR